MNESGAAILDLQGWSLQRNTPDGPVTLLDEIDLTVRRGEWVGILGANGSGKTSLLRYLAGEDSPLAASSGLIFQDPDEQLATGSVAEELALGRPQLDVAHWLGDFDLSRWADCDPRLLSAGQKQRLCVAVALAGQPDILLCDEPTALQDRPQARWLLDYLQSWRDRSGGTLLYATQAREEATLADRLLILDRGRIVAEGPSREVLASPWADRLLGPETAAGSSGPDLPRPACAVAPVGDVARPVDGHRAPAVDQGVIAVAEWQGVGCRFGVHDVFRGVDLLIGPGARIGITGRSGSGKSTLLAYAVGLLPPAEGGCHLRGRLLCADGGADLDHGAALLAPQFPEYFFTRTSLGEEMALDPALDAAMQSRILTVAGLPESALSRNPHSLSSGERRRLAVALVVLSGRDLLLLDEPTAGLDHPGRQQMLALLAEVPASSALVIASHDRAFLDAAGCELHRLHRQGLQPLSEADA